MRIVLTAASEQLLCPYCHDALKGVARSCERCHTSYHEECARLSGRCALLGCGGSLGALQGTPEVRLALVLVPPGEVSDELELALEKAIAFSRWDAHYKLLSSVPVVLGFFTRERIEKITRDLEKTDLELFALPPGGLAVRSFFSVHFVTREGESLVLETEFRARRVLELASKRFVVRGRHSKNVERTRWERRPAGPNVRAGPRGVRKKVNHETETARFVHVWLPDDPAAIVFEQGDLSNFGFLAAERSASSFENMGRLGDLLAAGQPGDASLDKLILSEDMALATSRLIAYARAPWLAGAGRA